MTVENTGMTLESLAESIKEGLQSEGLLGVEPYISKLSMGIAKGIYKELTIYGTDKTCPSVFVSEP